MRASPASSLSVVLQQWNLLPSDLFGTSDFSEDRTAEDFDPAGNLPKGLLPKLLKRLMRETLKNRDCTECTEKR
jgi:hypothetical protein